MTLASAINKLACLYLTFLSDWGKALGHLKVLLRERSDLTCKYETSVKKNVREANTPAYLIIVLRP